MKPDLFRIALCLTVGLVPLAYWPEMYAFTLLPKRFALYVGLTLISFGWFLRLRQNNIRSLTWSSTTTYLLAFVAISILSTFQTTHPLDSLLELVFLIALLGLFLITASAIQPEDIQALFWTLAITGLIVSIIAILQYHNLAFLTIPSNGHPSATFGYRNFAAMYLIGTIPIAILLFLQSTSKPAQILSALSTSSMLIFLIYTRTRGAWGGLGAACLLVIFLLLFSSKQRDAISNVIRQKRSSFKTYLLIASAGIIIVWAPLPPQFTDTGLQRFDEKKSDISATVTSVFQAGGDRGRFQMWANTLNLISDHPLFGVGLGGWKRIYPHYDQGVMIRQNSQPVRPHNDYLWIASEMGLVGFLCYLAFIISILVTLYRHSKTPSKTLHASLIAMSLLAILGHALFSFPKEHPQAMMLVFILSGLVTQWQKPRTLSNKWAIAISLLFVLHGLGASYLGYRAIRFDRHFYRALLAEDHNDWEAVEREVRAGLALGDFRSHMWIIAGRSAEQANRYHQAEEAYKHALALSPYNWHAHNGLGIVAKRQNQYDIALSHYLKALAYFPGKDNPNSVGIRTNLGALYKSMGRQQDAEIEYREILRSHPNHPGANNNMGNIYKAKGQLDSARVAYQQALATDSTLVQAHFNLSTLFLSQKRPNKALEHAEKAVALQPNQPQILWGLGQALEATNHPADAVQAYELALQQNPSFHQVRFNLANLYFDLRRYADAKHMYQIFLDNWQGDPKFTQFAQQRVITSEEYYRRSLK